MAENAGLTNLAGHPVLPGGQRKRAAARGEIGGPPGEIL